MTDAALARPAADWSGRRVAIPDVLEGLSPPPDTARVHRLDGETMGTTWSVSVACTPDIDLVTLRAAIVACLDGIIDEMSTWLTTSTLSRFNGSADEWVALPRDLTAVLACALAVARASGGAYDPTIGPVVNLWGFGPAGGRTSPPLPADIARAQARCGWARIELDDTARRARQPGGMYVDLSGIAKGFAVDAVADRVERNGVGSYLVEIGGELRGRGMKPDGQPWWVAVEPPAAPDRRLEWVGPPVALLVALHELSIATSGDYRRGFISDGTWYSHTIDPRSARPIEHAVASVTVLHRECMMADALSTAITVLGVVDGMAFAAERKIPALFMVRAGNGIRPLVSPALESLLQ